MLEIHEMDITSMNKRMTYKDLDSFVVALKRAVFSGFTKSCFRILLNFTWEKEFTVSFIGF